MDVPIEGEEEVEAEITTFFPSVLPRDQRNQDLDDQDLPQPEFGIGILSLDLRVHIYRIRIYSIR